MIAIIESPNDGIRLLEALHSTFVQIASDDTLDMEEIDTVAHIMFVNYMITQGKDNTLYSLMLEKLETITSKDKYLCSLKQAVSCRVQDVIDTIVSLMDDVLFIQGTIQHQCLKKAENVCLIELADISEQTICLVKRSNHSRFFRFNKSGREKHIFNLQGFEGYDHEIHFPDQLDDGEVIDFLPYIIQGLKQSLTPILTY